MSLEPRQHPSTGSLKLTLRMKNGDNYEVLRRPELTSSKNNIEMNVNHPVAVLESWRQIRKKEKKNRKREISNSSTGSNGSGSGLKRLKLRLGDETMSTIDLDTSG